jgi:putative ABC transport system permease protein
MLSVLLGVALAVSIMIVQRGGQALFGQSDYGYDVLIGPRGSPLQLVLNTVYHLDASPGNIPYSIYEQLSAARHPQVRQAVPYAVGDTYKGLRIVGTTPRLFGFDDALKPIERPFEYRPGKSYMMAQGRPFHPKKFEAVIGSEVPRLTGLGIGSRFKATHGDPVGSQKPDEHDEQWEVVGILAPTRTANDRVLFIPLISFYAISGHEKALEAQAALKAGLGIDQIEQPHPASAPTTEEAHDHDHDHGDEHAEDEHHHHDEAFEVSPEGIIDLKLPREKWQLSAILVKSRGGVQAMQLMWSTNNLGQATALNPASVMREFFSTFLSPSARLLQGIAFLVTIVAAVGILVSIYNSISARKREIAILRALGATRARILTLICLEAGLIGLIGGVLGLLVGHLLALGGSLFLQRLVGEGLNWLVTPWQEWLYLGVVVVIAVLAGLIPALKAYRTPVATNLVSG